MRIKFTKNVLLERLNIDEKSLMEFIRLGLLIPEGWENISYSQLIMKLEKGFQAVWYLHEVEKFEEIMRMFQKNYHLFVNQIERRFNSLENSFENISTHIQEHDHAVKFLLTGIRKIFEEQYDYITADEFCETTGYSKRTFYNAIRIVDTDVPTMKLDIQFYKGLLWIKRGRRWMARRAEFEDLRKNFSYDLLLIEKHRKANFKKVKVS